MNGFNENFFITIKYAQSLDGKIATISGDSKWISNSKALYFAHKLRARHDAILVGINTIIKDNPELNVRLKEIDQKVQPARIILDKNLKIFSLDFKKLKLLKTYKNINTFIFYDKNLIEPLSIIEKLNLTTNIEYFKKFNVKFFGINAICNYLDIKELLNILYNDLKIKSLLVEGGGKVITEFFKNNFFDKMFIIVAPIFIGDDGISAIKELGFLTMEKVKSMQKIKLVQTLQLDEQIVYEFINKI